MPYMYALYVCLICMRRLSGDSGPRRQQLHTGPAPACHSPGGCAAGRLPCSSLQQVRQKRPSIRQKRPSIRQKRPSIRQKRPSIRQKRPSRRQKRPSIRQKRPIAPTLRVSSTSSTGFHFVWTEKKNCACVLTSTQSLPMKGRVLFLLDVCRR